MASTLRLEALFEVKDRWIAITGAGEVPSKENNWLNIDMSLSASGIGRMLARGCAVNGANTILIDVNERSLEAAKTELQQLMQTGDLPPTSVVTSVPHTYPAMTLFLNDCTGYMKTFPARQVSQQSLPRSSQFAIRLMLSYIAPQSVT